MKTLDEPTVENGTPRLAYGLLTDLYQLTMAQGYWENGKLGEQACFTVFFRDAPFKGGFAIACGMSQLAEMIDGFEFTESDIEYLAGLNAPGGGKQGRRRSAFHEPPARRNLLCPGDHRHRLLCP